MMIIDTGKARVNLYNDKDNIIVVDIYTDGELLMKDVDEIHHAMKQFNIPTPTDTICVKSGRNFLSEEAFEYAMDHNCIHNKIVYVIEHMADIHFPSEAQETFFSEHLVDYCSSIDDAYYLLKNGSS